MQSVEVSIDPLGKIYFYKDRVFRVIKETHIGYVQEMFSCGLVDELITKNLFPKTWISDILIEGCSLVLEHEKIEHWNYPYEWSFDMLKDAGLSILKIDKIANQYGYQVMDGHSSNIVFNMGYPQYIDFGSFVKYDKKQNISWQSYNIFYNHFYIPLFLWSKGYPDIARNIFLMRDYFDDKEFYKLKYPLLDILSIGNFAKMMKIIKKLAIVSKQTITTKIKNSKKQKIALFINAITKPFFLKEKLEYDIKKIDKKTEHSMWNDYHDSIDPSTNKRFLRVLDVIQDLKDAKSLIELASNQGKFAELILKKTTIKKVIATDYDKEAVNIMYLNNKNKDNFLPLLFDMVRTNGRKYDKFIHERIKSDIVVALAVTHHLILTQEISIDYIFKTLKKLTNKYIVIEFMPLGLYSGDINNIPKTPDFYTDIWFKDNFKKYFDLILDEKLEINRHLFVGKLKSSTKDFI